MNPIQNVRAVVSAVVGLGGGPLGLVGGWGAKAFTSSETTLKQKTVIGATSTVLSSGGTWVLTNYAPQIDGWMAHLSFLGGAITDVQTAGIVALCTGASYLLGPSWNLASKPKPTVRRW